jgi:AcrR family transcriptional regulator
MGAAASGPRETTRERLIEAAKELFSQNGYAATGTRAIAKRAGCNLSLIKHYFGSKEGLLLELVSQNMALAGDRLRAVAASTGSAEERLGQLIDFIVDHFDHYREGLRLFHREVVTSEGDFLADVKPLAAANAAILAALMREAHQKGELRDVDPLVASMLLMGMVQFYFIAYPITSRVLGERTPELVESIKRNIKEIFLRGVLR